MSSEHRPIVATLTNYGYRELTLNLYLSMQAIGMKDTLHIGCIDEAAHAWICARAPHANVFLIPNPIAQTQWIEFESEGWPEVTFNKFKVIHSLLSAGRKVVFLDGDIVLLRDPIPEMMGALGDLDAVFQDDGKEGVHDELCTGCFLVRPNASMLALFDPRQISMKGFRDDQKHINKHRDSIRHARLSTTSFPVGWRIHDHHHVPTLLNRANLLHFNWCSGTEKIRRIKDMGFWRVAQANIAHPLRITAFCS